MSLASAFGRLWDPGDAARADNASDALSQALAPGSDYWKSGQLTGDQGVISGAAQLAANKVGVNTFNMDADTAATSALGAQFGNIAQNGGQLTDAVLAQARSDLANTNVHQLDQASRQQAAQVLAQDSAERNWAAQHQNQTRAQALANQLQKQLFNTSITHANFESALNAHALQNADRNAAYDLANEVAVGGRNAANNQQTLGRQQQATDFNNAMTTAQMVGAALSAGAGTIAGMGGIGGSVASGMQTGYTPGAQNYDAGYAVPTAALGTSMKAGALSSKAATADTPGMLEKGNVDLAHRQIVYNDDGTWSTVRSMTFKDGDKYVVVPSAYGGALHSADEAWQHYKETGEHMGKFSSSDAADAYAESVHDDQATQFKPQQSGWDGVMGPVAPTQSKYTNPITGNTVNANMPSDASAWGDWLTGTSSLVGA